MKFDDTHCACDRRRLRSSSCASALSTNALASAAVGAAAWLGVEPPRPQATRLRPAPSMATAAVGNTGRTMIDSSMPVTSASALSRGPAGGAERRASYTPVVPRIAVFCGSRAGNHPAYAEAAAALGRALAHRGCELVY